MNSLFVVSPAKGIIIKELNWMTDQKWAVGDQPYSGSNIIELPDLSAMRAEVLCLIKELKYVLTPRAL